MRNLSFLVPEAFLIVNINQQQLQQFIRYFQKKVGIVPENFLVVICRKSDLNVDLQKLKQSILSRTLEIHSRGATLVININLQQLQQFLLSGEGVWVTLKFKFFLDGDVDWLGFPTFLHWCVSQCYARNHTACMLFFSNKKNAWFWIPLRAFAGPFILTHFQFLQFSNLMQFEVALFC